jgi:uncharacterized protein YigA (DUF484 family)
MRLDVYFHNVPDSIIIERIEEMSAALDRLTAEVAENRSSVDSAIALIAGLAQQIRDLSDDPAALNALADELDAQQADIAVAVNSSPSDEPPAEEPA